MRTVLFLITTTLPFLFHAQSTSTEAFIRDSLLLIQKNTEKGFYWDYILFIPRETPLHQKTFLLVEPNNTGKTSDSVQVHTQYAMDLASVSSVGNNISTMLKIPFLVPIFPRPESRPLLYTHALDRDAITETSPELQRLDLQLLAMIEDAQSLLEDMGIPTNTKIFMNGFSASATFTNRFSFIHPEAIQALAIGGFNGELILPQPQINGVDLNYPLGTKDFTTLFGQNFDKEAFKHIPQFIYMGQLDQNDAVQFDDAYSEQERQIINKNLGDDTQERYLKCQEIYLKNHINPTFKTYEDVGHWTTSDVNFEVIKFFFHQMQTQE
ncbi:MAG: hypothetical protein CMI36_04295 [Owenweeksia sp.]|nr:hypothetical protein [Owenweeksia sp.]MBF98190.1 hypothetical protein [Owenweeksia sp.]HBF21479.1 hypothetical protein [Cryomorphaceae bacterium]HCQ14778.1 hypothetical protein [Cryomorphaceae bacterium]|tara:strand:- start:951 stop:1922 length:972 start_codon:yes stop_codon:yes gene_type:complete